MMRSHLRIVCAILLAGFTSGSDVTTSLPIQRYDVYAGDRFPVEILTYYDDVIACLLICPNGSVIGFKPVDDSNEKFEKQTDTDTSQCSAIINIDEEDSGLWKLISHAADGTKRIQIYETTVNTRSIDTTESTAYTESNAVTESTTGTESGFTSGVTASPSIQRYLNAGERLLVEIPTFGDDVISCRLLCPNESEIEFKPVDESSEKFEKQADTELSKCRAKINIVEGDSGLWVLKSKAADGRERIQIYEIIVNTKSTDTTESTAYSESTAFTESTTTSTESDTEDHKRVEYLAELFINTEFGSTHEISIPDFPFGRHLGCQLIMPNGTMIDVEELEYEESTKVISRTASSSCSVAINLVSSDFIVYLGDWKLISEGFVYSDKVEKRLPFTIHIEKFVESAAHKVTVREGNNFYMAVPYFNHEYSETCRLLPPYGATTNYTRLNGGCSFKVYNVMVSDSGIWEINYGDKIRYRAITHLRVNGATTPSEILLYWNEDKPVEANLVPDAVYCRIRTPEEYVVYDGFGPCRIALPRAIKSQHEGFWKLDVGMPGQVITDNYTVNVVVQEAIKPMVRTSVKGNSPDDIHMKNMYLSCALDSPHPIGFCKFRDPSGRILIAAEAVGESRYSWHGTGTNYTAGVYAHECGIRITNTNLNDFGIWRCAIDTDGGTYYGFLTAKALWIRDPEIAATITTVPTLRADRSTFTSLIEESVTLSCSIQAPIRYCYFRARNGTVYNVAPSASHDSATYAGAGFEAGECGVRFPSLATSDSGSWSCHVGLLEPIKQEQRARFEVIINDTMVVSQRGPSRDYNWLTLEAQVYNKRPLDYCRFVRIDGLGFTDKTPHIPLNVEERSDLWRGLCSISIRDPTNLDQHPWTIVARIRGQDTELARVTDIAFPIPRPPAGVVRFRLPGAWIIVMSIGICMILLASFVGPKRNREWTYARASAIRNSIMRKKVEQNANEPTRNTAVAA